MFNFENNSIQYVPRIRLSRNCIDTERIPSTIKSNSGTSTPRTKQPKPPLYSYRNAATV